jgi:hypothetical protein
LVSAAVLAALAVGCGSVPKPVHTYGKVVDYDRMTDHYDPLVSLVYSSGDHTLDEYHTLYIDSFQAASGDLVKNYEEARLFGLRFRYTLKNQIAEQGNFETVSVSDRLKASDTSGVLVLEPMITVWNKGSGWKRFFLWRGATDFQIECQLVDADTSEVVMELVDRRRFLANTPWGPNIDTFWDDYVMKLTLKETAVCLADFLDKAHHGLPGPGRAGNDG